MSRYWSPLVKSLTPYVPGEQPKITNLIKLNTNENPYGPSSKVLEAIRSEASDNLRLYPDPNADTLKQTIADYHSVDKNQVFVGNGSDEVIAIAFQALFKHPNPLLFPDITYSFYPVWSDMYQVDYQTVPVTDNFEIDVQAFKQANGGIIFPNPNAPTGRLLPLDQIKLLLEINTDSVVVVDEAYIDFGGESAIALVNDYPNLLVIHTLSKSRSLAGMRVGFAIGHPDLIEGMERVKNSFNSYPLDRPAQAAAVASFLDEEYFQSCCQKVIASRESLTEALTALGFEVLPSAANFIFAKHPEHDAETLANQLRERSIIVRYFKKPKIDQFLRISIGSTEECEQLATALKDMLG
ncbi:histidinol-phosphate transaminase [Litoribrevibacter albus]|uniref:Histidinol-phosphate aminotransferase n=1 Tax=Litoribrevibacter albus TaxID=1473156 RepID=A0AA37W6G0_9GAMM|nr:histidinol-phosphate transaminase [Litoribrevibacter albus]GLQ29849.1 histidinol-phosphate aminotransferase [Litoribrevibacter albus]